MIAKKHAQQYMPNGELSLEQVIQAAIDEAAKSAAVPVVGDPVAWRWRYAQKSQEELATKMWGEPKFEVRTVFSGIPSKDAIERALLRGCYPECLYHKPTTSIAAAELDALRKDAASNADRDIAIMRASIIAYKEARNGIERHPGNTAHENAAWEWGRKDGGWENKK